LLRKKAYENKNINAYDILVNELVLYADSRVRKKAKEKVA
jgi:hypothetical protein